VNPAGREELHNVHCFPYVVGAMGSTGMKCVRHVLLVPRNFSRGRGVIPSLAERGSSLVSMGTSSLECSVLKCGQATQRTIHLTTL
jgi:hypothetical protein